MKSCVFAALLLAFVAAVGNSLASELGDQAAPLQVAKWIKGDPVKVGAPSDTIYVVEFWATWCPPCVGNIPHLTELQKKYAKKNIRIVGISIEDDVATVKSFVDAQGDKMAYTVAIDSERKTADAYLKAFGQKGIPSVFIVDRQGKVCWYGYPWDEAFETTLAKQVGGNYTIEMAKKDAAEREREARQRKAVQSLGSKYLEFAKDEALSAITKDVGELYVKHAAGDATMLNDLAAGLLNGHWVPIEQVDKVFLLRLAKSAYDADPNKPKFIVVYAKALNASGKKAEAVELLKKKIPLAAQPRDKTYMESELKKIEEKKPTPGTPNNAWYRDEQ